VACHVKRAKPKAKAAAPEPALPAVAYELPCLAADTLRLLTGLTDRRHRQLAEAGYYRPPIRGVYGADAIPGLFKYFTEQLHKKNEKLAKEQYELTKAKRETAQEELAILREECVRKTDIGPALRNISLHQRAVLQRKLEQELGPNLSGLRTVEILGRLRAAVDEICAVFREGVSEWCAEGKVKSETRDPKAEGNPKDEIRDPNSQEPIAVSQGTMADAAVGI